jgi:RecA-family ATPase
MRRFDVPLLAPWVDQALNKPEQDWLIDGLFPAGGLSFIAGRPKLSMKSWLAYASAMAMSSGRAVGPLRPSRKVKVMYLNLEGAERPTAERWPLLSAGSGISLEECDMHFMHGHPFMLDDDKDTVELVKYCVDLGVKCVFVDTFARSHSGDENSARDVGAALRGVDRFLHAGIAVVVIHHVRKQDTKNTTLLHDPDSDLRGSSALSGAYDSLVAIKCVSNPESANYDLYAQVGGKFAEFKAHRLEWTIDDKGARLSMEEADLSDIGGAQDENDIYG